MRRFWAGVAGSCWVTDSEGGHRGLRCHGATSGQCIFPVYSGNLPVTRTCSDHSNQVIVLQPSFRILVWAFILQMLRFNGQIGYSSFLDFFLQIFDETYICYGGSMVYSRAEYPHCR